MHVSVRGLRTSQAFPNWWPEFMNGDSGVAPYTFNATELSEKRLAGYPYATPPFNYNISYGLGSNSYTAQTVRGGAIQRFPDSGKPAWDFSNGSQPPTGSSYYLTNSTSWTRSLELTGNWLTAYDLDDLFRDDYLYIPAGSGANQVEYFFSIAIPGQYKVLAWWPSSISNTTSAKYTVNYADGSTTVSVDQSANGGQWNEIGQFNFDAGEYSVVINDDTGSGRVVADGIRVGARENPPAVIQADFIADTRYGVAPLDVTFESTSTGDISTYQWNFGDGSTNSSRTYITHTYTTDGCKDVTFTVNGPEGTSKMTKKDYICVGSTTETLRAEFSVGAHEGTAPMTVSFSDESSGNVVSWLWDFGDGTTSTSQNPTHQYTQPGNYTVSLTVNGSSTETKNNFVVVRFYDKILDNVDYPKAHYRSKTILFRRADDLEIKPTQLKYNRLYYEACNSGNYYLDTFKRGVVFYTLNTANGLAFSAYIRGYIAGKSDLRIWQEMQAKEPVYDYYNFNKTPTQQ
jgi:PKD repeat protein